MATLKGGISPAADTLRGRISSPGSLHGSLRGLEKIQGYSAYQVAVINGFEGSEEEWLESLKGDTPEIGKNGNWWIGGVDTGVPASGGGSSGGGDGGSYDLQEIVDAVLDALPAAEEASF